MNAWTIAGRVGRDAEIKTTQTGKTVTEWSVAVDGFSGGEKTTTWVDCSMWGDRGVKLVDHLKKGRYVVVAGECSTHAYTSQGGEVRASLRLNVRELTLGPASTGERQDHAPATTGAQPRPPATRSSPPKNAPAGGFSDDEIPF